DPHRPRRDRAGDDAEPAPRSGAEARGVAQAAPATADAGPRTAAGWPAARRCAVKRAAMLLLAACGSSPPATVDATSDTGLDAANGERTLETCETSIDASVPAPYASMFTCVTATATATDLVITTRALPPHRT